MEIEKNIKKVNTDSKETGIFVKGFIMSSSARVIERKDGSGKMVITKHEISLKPGLAVLDTFFDPSEHSDIEIVGEEVVRYPHVEDFQPVHLRVHRFDSVNGVMQIKKAEWVA